MWLLEDYDFRIIYLLSVYYLSLLYYRMCWIFGYKWVTPQAEKILLQGLQRLEYRWYDSAGIWVSNGIQKQCIKSVGKVSQLASKVMHTIADNWYTMWIAHTRWATHGWITEQNTHPHNDQNETFTIVHNGIIENYHKIKQDLLAKWYKFYGETDTEVVANLLADNRDGNFLSTVEKTLMQLRGAYALLITTSHAPEEMIGVKVWSPLLFGTNTKNEFFFSSDAQALVWYADQIIHLHDGEMVHVAGISYAVLEEGEKVIKTLEKIDATILEASKGDYKHFMIKEIFEQPAIIRRLFMGRVDFDNYTLTAETFYQLSEEKFEKVVFIWCGTSYNAGWLGSYWMQDIAWIDATYEIASEMEYKNYKVKKDTLYVFISQSGETADSIQVLKDIKNKGGETFGIVNVPGSTIARLTGRGLFTRAWAEIGVASTKAFTAQLINILLLALFLGKRRELSLTKFKRILDGMHQLPALLEDVLQTSDTIRETAKNLVPYKNFFFLGKHYHVPIAAEVSLKFKEITYLHSEAYPMGELKHGPLAMIDDTIPSILFMPSDYLLEKNISSMHEIAARKWKLLTLSDTSLVWSDRSIQIPETIDELYPLVSVVAGQLLSYHVADMLDRDIDKPRNLAKSVTVK